MESFGLLSLDKILPFADAWRAGTGPSSIPLEDGPRRYQALLTRAELVLDEMQLVDPLLNSAHRVVVHAEFFENHFGPLFLSTPPRRKSLVISPPETECTYCLQPLVLNCLVDKLRVLTMDGVIGGQAWEGVCPNADCRAEFRSLTIGQWTTTTAAPSSSAAAGASATDAPATQRLFVRRYRNNFYKSEFLSDPRTSGGKSASGQVGSSFYVESKLLSEHHALNERVQVSAHGCAGPCNMARCVCTRAAARPRSHLPWHVLAISPALACAAFGRHTDALRQWHRIEELTHEWAAVHNSPTIFDEVYFLWLVGFSQSIVRKWLDPDFRLSTPAELSNLESRKQEWLRTATALTEAHLKRFCERHMWCCPLGPLCRLLICDGNHKLGMMMCDNVDLRNLLLEGVGWIPAGCERDPLPQANVCDRCLGLLAVKSPHDDDAASRVFSDPGRADAVFWTEKKAARTANEASRRKPGSVAFAGLETHGWRRSGKRAVGPARRVLRGGSAQERQGSVPAGAAAAATAAGAGAAAAASTGAAGGSSDGAGAGARRSTSSIEKRAHAISMKEFAEKTRATASKRKEDNKQMTGRERFAIEHPVRGPSRVL